MKKSILVSFLALAFLVTTACANKQVGKPVGTQITPLAQVLANPSAYHNKTVTMTGTVSAQCGSLCEFTFTEKGKSAMIFMGSLKKDTPRIKSGTPVTVAVKVHAGEGQVVLNAEGYKLGGKK